jgi:hypothetical protein
MRSFGAAAFSAVVFLLYPATISAAPSAADQARCQAYAGNAVNHANTSLSRKCEFFGPRWHTKYQEHYGWCLKVPAASAASETKAREQELETCPGAAPVLPAARPDVFHCQVYAQVAVREAQTNLERGCGFSGRRWLTDYDAHYKWCLGAPPALVVSEQRARQLDLSSKCPGTTTPDPEGPRPVQPEDHKKFSCSIYARIATHYAEMNLTRGCGLSGPRWSNDYAAHYKWCFGAPPALAASETRARREELLAKCPGGPVPPPPM